MVYYENLANQNIILKKSDFESITIKQDNKPDEKLEQEMVTALFKNKEEVRAEEAFTYNFVNNLKKIKTFMFKDIVDFFELIEDYKDEILSKDRFRGTFLERFITQDYSDTFSTRLKEFLIQYFPNRTKNYINTGWIAWYDSYDSMIYLPKDFRLKHLERGRYHENFQSMLDVAFLHEIGHVHSKKSFPKFFDMLGVAQVPYLREDAEISNYLSNILDLNEVYPVSNEVTNNFIESSTLEYIGKGSTDLDETLNEIYAGVTRGNCYFVPNEQILSERYYMKKHCCNIFENEETYFEAFSPYYLHADIPAMLKTLYPNLTLFEIRNNSLNLKNALNKLEIDDNVRLGLETILNDFDLATRGIKASNKRVLLPDSHKKLKDGEEITFDVDGYFEEAGITNDHKLSNAELFFLALGVSYEEFELVLDEPDNNESFEIKSALQACLINAHKNNLLKLKQTHKDFYKQENLNKLFDNLLYMDLCTIRSKGKNKTISELEFEKLLKTLGIESKYSHYKFYHEQEKSQTQLKL